MGGSGGGGGGGSNRRTGAFASHGSKPVACEDLRITTTIMSPQTTLISSLHVGQRLQLRKNIQDQLEVLIPGVLQPLGILGDNALAILECMEKGVYYVVEVLRIQALTVDVSIYHE